MEGELDNQINLNLTENPHKRVTSIKFTKQQSVSQLVSESVSY